MSFGKVDAGNGLNWLTEAIGIVFRNPGAFLVMALIVVVIFERGQFLAGRRAEQDKIRDLR